jgi:site-specific DNA recombinase
MIRCAIYTRKSTDEGLDQAFNTLDAQREAGEAYVASQRHEGWITLPQHYDDGGYTGANMDRPALKRLLGDVEAGVVSCVVVYKVDRLTRSLLDFARIVEVFDKHGVTFVSVTQQFNTTASLGRLTLNILLSFAQFEREMISERTRDKMRAARRKGKFVGGNLVLGYDVAPLGGSLVINEAEAQQVRAIFQLYLDYGALIPVVEELNRRGWTLKAWTTREGRQVGGTCFTKSKLYNLLTNYAYAGKVHYEGKVFEGEHERIIDDALFDRVQELLRHNGRESGRTLHSKYSALLKGLVRCGSCGASMFHTYTKRGTRLYRYYVCAKAQQQGWNQCATRSVSAPALEAAVVEQIRSIGRSPALLAEVLRKLAGNAQARSSDVRRQLAQLDAELKTVSADMATLATTASSPGAEAKEAIDGLADLHRRAEELEQQRSVLVRTSAPDGPGIDANDVQRTLEQFNPLWEQMTGWEQEKLIRSLLEEVRFDGEAGVVTLGFRSSGLKELCQNGTAQHD